jgi:hypothetical protein
LNIDALSNPHSSPILQSLGKDVSFGKVILGQEHGFYGAREKREKKIGPRGSNE